MPKRFLRRLQTKELLSLANALRSDKVASNQVRDDRCCHCQAALRRN